MKKTYQSRKGLTVVKFSILLLGAMPAFSQSSIDFEILGNRCERNYLRFVNSSILDSSDIIDAYRWHFEGPQVESEWARDNQDYLAKWQTSGTKEVSLTIYLKSGDSLVRTKSIMVKKSPVANFSVEDYCCNSEMLVVNNLSTVDSGELSFNWHYWHYDFNKPPCENAGEQKLSLTATGENGCSGYVMKTYNILPKPNATIEYKVYGSRVHFFGPDSNDVYRWRFGDGGESQLKDVIYTYERFEERDTIFFTACLATKKGDCWNQSCVDIEVTVGVNDISYLGIEIYPNPSTGLFTIENQNSENYTIQVSDILGHTVNFSQTGNVIDLSELENGIYTLALKGENYYVTKKVLLSR